jgi:ribosomal protein L21E
VCQIGKVFGSNWESFWVKLGKFLGQIGKVFGSNWESFWVKLGNFAMISLPESSENAMSQREMFRGPTKKNFRQIAGQIGKVFGSNWESFWVKSGKFLGQIGKVFGSNRESFLVKSGKFLGQIGKVFESNWESF